jgi:hypothetical protein
MHSMSSSTFSCRSTPRAVAVNDLIGAHTGIGGNVPARIRKTDVFR